MHKAEKDKMKSDFLIEISVKNALIKQLENKGVATRDALTKLIKMLENPRLVQLASKLLSAEKQEERKRALTPDIYAAGEIVTPVEEGIRNPAQGPRDQTKTGSSRDAELANFFSP